MTDNLVFKTSQINEVLPEIPVDKTLEVNQKDESDLITPEIIDLVLNYQQGINNRLNGEVAEIHVDEIASKIATFYEKIRKVIDWKEENVLRRSAILRILKRSLISKISEITIIRQSSDVNVIAENLTLELIRGGHLPNNEIPTGKVDEVAQVISKYIYVLEKAPYNQTNELVIKKKVNFYDFILEIAACEIEDVLACPFKENALIKAMTNLLAKRVRLIPENTLDPEKKKTLIYIAVCRTLFDLDDPFISYHMLTHYYPQWEKPSQEFLAQMTQNIFRINEKIEADLHHPLSKNFFTIGERIDTVFTLIGDLLDHYEKEPEKIIPVLNNQEKFKELLTQFYNKRVKSLKKRLFRLAIFSTLSVFMSNWATFLILEIPIANFFYEGFSLTAAIADFMIPSIFMFILVSMIKPPSASNLEVVLKTAFQFVYQNDEVELYEIKVKKKLRPIFNFIITILYLLGMTISFGVIAYLFYLAKIPITSVIFDTMTISLNVFAAMVIRNKSKELSVQERTTAWEFLLDYLSLPVAQVGNFLGDKWKEYNIFTVFFNYILELPFLSFVDFVENWSVFLKEKKADIH